MGYENVHPENFPALDIYIEKLKLIRDTQPEGNEHSEFFRNAINAVDSGQEITVFRFEDFNTEGLEGNDGDETKSFNSLVLSEGYSVKVVKPAWEPRIGRQNSPVVYTSAMDHPIGQLFAAAKAADYPGEVRDCGLLTHWLFEPTEFSEALQVEDRRLVPPGGTGLGFNELLDGLPWKSL